MNSNTVTTAASKSMTAPFTPCRRRTRRQTSSPKSPDPTPPRWVSRSLGPQCQLLCVSVFAGHGCRSCGGRADALGCVFCIPCLAHWFLTATFRSERAEVGQWLCRMQSKDVSLRSISGCVGRCRGGDNRERASCPMAVANCMAEGIPKPTRSFGAGKIRSVISHLVDCISPDEVCNLHESWRWLTRTVRRPLLVNPWLIAGCERALVASRYGMRDASTGPGVARMS